MPKAIDLEIKKNVPLPEKKSFYASFPWERINVGDSFPVTKEVFGENPIEKLRTVISLRHQATKERFSVRKTDDGTRCWRIE